MSQERRSPSSRAEDGRNKATQVSLQIWHPECWTLQATEAVDAGLLGHSVHEYDGFVHARLTAYADRQADIDELVEEIDKSELTTEVKRIHSHFDPHRPTQAAGNATEELLVRYAPANSIHKPFLSRGFIPDREIRVCNGLEYWTVIASMPKSSIQDRLDEIRQEMNADIDVIGTKPVSADQTGPVEGNCLTERQREVLELARRQGYYAWPRDISATELAGELGVTKATALEHLRKAEAKLLDLDP